MEKVIEILDNFKYLDNYAILNKSKFIRADFKKKIGDLEGFINIVDKILIGMEQKKEDIIYSENSYSQDEDFIIGFKKQLEKKKKKRQRPFNKKKRKLIKRFCSMRRLSEIPRKRNKMVHNGKNKFKISK